MVQAASLAQGAENQVKNRNLHTSIGNYDGTSSQFGPGATSSAPPANHSSLIALNQQFGQHYANQIESSMSQNLTQSGTRFQKRLLNNFMGEPDSQLMTGGFQRMSTAAINSASAHRQGTSKKLTEGRKSVSRTNAAAGPQGGQTTMMHSLINDESILSQQLTGKAVNHSSLIVDSTNN